jgi:anhydro-N-acetylmuramic acid kinase
VYIGFYGFGSIMKQFAPIWALGTMSGTSLDGVDAAAILTDGVDISEFGDFAYRAYTPRERAILSKAMGRWPGDVGVKPAARIVVAKHQSVCRKIAADCIGFHGQTLAHDPSGLGTHQAGDGAQLAMKSGRKVVWDFRSADVALGGQGAPLAPFFHWACARYAGLTKPVAFLNLGGVGNITFVDPAIDAPEKPGAVLAFDTGPANAPINDLVFSQTGDALDLGGHLASRGTVDQAFMRSFHNAVYFAKMPPKSLDRDSFTALFKPVHAMALTDAVATLTACAVAGVERAFDHAPSEIAALYVCGGGRKNATMMRMLTKNLDTDVQPAEAIGLDGDMLEAQAFGYLAVRVLRGLPTSCPTTTGVVAAVGGGQISQPD